MRWRLLKAALVWLCLLCVLAACGESAPERLPTTLVGEALTTDGPVLWSTENGLTAAWVDTDASDVFQVARHVASDAVPVVLPLPPRHPFAQQGVPASDRRLHLLWLDANADTSNRLYSALLTPDLRVERGPVEVSDRFTQHYAVVAAPDGGAWLAWTGGPAAEPALYTQRLDAQGRPREAQRIALNAAWPALTASDDTPLLFWLDRASGGLWQAAVDGSDAIQRSGGVELAAGDRVVGVSAAVAEGFVIFVWNVTRADGTDESWLTGGSLAGSQWPVPTLVTVGIEDGPLPVRWLVVGAQADRLIGAGQVDRQVGLLAFDRTRPTVLNSLASLTADLIGPMRMALTGDSSVAVGWAEPGPNGARLQVAVGR